MMARIHTELLQQIEIVKYYLVHLDQPLHGVTQRFLLIKSTWA